MCGKHCCDVSWWHTNVKDYVAHSVARITLDYVYHSALHHHLGAGSAICKDSLLPNLNAEAAESWIFVASVVTRLVLDNWQNLPRDMHCLVRALRLLQPSRIDSTQRATHLCTMLLKIQQWFLNCEKRATYTLWNLSHILCWRADKRTSNYKRVRSPCTRNNTRNAVTSLSFSQN